MGKREGLVKMRKKKKRIVRAREREMAKLRGKGGGIWTVGIEVGG